MKFSVTFLLVMTFISVRLYGQYDEQFVERSITNFRGVKLGCVDLMIDDGHVKTKLFSGADENGDMVYQQYKSWSLDKKIIAVTSFSFIQGCTENELPYGLYVNNGRIISDNFETTGYDGVLCFSEHEITFSDLKDKKINTISCGDKSSIRVNPKNKKSKNRFLTWAKNCSATVLQVPLLYYNKQFHQDTIRHNTYPTAHRIWAIGKDNQGKTHHFLLYYSTIEETRIVARQAYQFLTTGREITDLLFMTKLKTGCQDIFEVRKENGSIDTRDCFNGTTDISYASNLLVYYYE
jgi:hypothetical protein